MASAQAFAPEPEEGVKVEEEVYKDDVARESEVEDLDLTNPMVEDKPDPFEVKDELQEEDEEGQVGITEVPTYAEARFISDNDDDELDVEYDGASDEDTIHHFP